MSKLIKPQDLLDELATWGKPTEEQRQEILSINPAHPHYRRVVNDWVRGKYDDCEDDVQSIFRDLLMR